ncbi:glycoside hydrolase family 172 protein [Rubellicoccus peritrichatus]|uniref:Glycoside hydrolase family 172 protein n=1 Tax=Rubellicoccus peritrichatus TaxID=3080537 RepID=A0AAQ3QUL7_9BACT|nr:glycoside hydrolase family 172 protein [Puniceicoccus sp. CR14]WOO40065.1 glycoside hydrolase family 172 protein [Puniceicoccus sp. CR14]
MLTLEQLLREMTDLAHLTEFPKATYKTIQFASYDRRSSKPYEPGWYANEDGFGGEPVPNFEAILKEPGDDGVGEYLIGEVQGPGVICRLWTAHIIGRIQVFLDECLTPIYDGEAVEFLQRPYQSLGGQSELDDSFSQRAAGYFPIPFSKSCRIVWHGKISDPHFYAVQVRCYPKGFPIECFQRDHLKQYATTIEDASRRLKEIGRDEAHSTQSTNLEPDERKVIFEQDGSPAAIHCLQLKANSADINQALRKTILRVYFDDAPTPQIESPVGDFFSAGPGVNPFETLPMSVSPDGWMTCRFPMPFRSSTRIVLENWSASKVTIDSSIEVAPYNWQDGETMHFFAKWRADHGLLTRHHNEDHELPFLCAKGKGVLVGIASIIMNPTNCPTRHGGWWGEGDEKVWVDDDDFPSIFGTGTEDYFNYAWSSDELFHHPYFAQPQATGPGNRGYISNARWHILDPIPFEKNIFFFIELITHLPTQGLSYARLAYFYSFPHLRDDHVQLHPSTTIIPELPAWEPIAASNTGTEGAVFYQCDAIASECTGGQIHFVKNIHCAKGVMLKWTGGQKGDSLMLKIPTPQKASKTSGYRFGIVCHAGPESGSVKICVNDQVINEPRPIVNLHHPYTHQMKTIQGNLDLFPENGEQILSITLKDNDTMLGLDFIWVTNQ